MDDFVVLVFVTICYIYSIGGPLYFICLTHLMYCKWCETN